MVAEYKTWRVLSPSAAYNSHHSACILRRKRMLILKPNCECCDKDLPPEAADARICTFECTFCATCVESKLGGFCPNCGGNFAPRPLRPPAMLLKYPASTTRVFKPQGCARVA